MGNNNCTNLCLQRLQVEFSQITNRPITKPIVKLQTLIRGYLTRKIFMAILFDLYQQKWDVIFKKVNLVQFDETYIKDNLKYLILNFYRSVFTFNTEQKKYILNETNYNFKVDDFISNFKPLILLYMNKYFYLGNVRKILKEVSVEYEIDDNLFEKINYEIFAVSEDKSKITEMCNNVTIESPRLSFSKKNTGGDNSLGQIHTVPNNTIYIKNAPGNIPIRNQNKGRTTKAGYSNLFKEGFFNKKIILVDDKYNKEDEYNRTLPSNKSTFNSENNYQGRVKLFDSMDSLYFEKILEEMKRNPHILITTFDRENGIFYQGGWDIKQKCRSNFGTLFSVNWVNGIRYKYKGYFRNNLFHGYGVLIREDGFLYQGEFRNGKQSGFGIQIFGEKVYQGFFYDGLYHGFGELFINHSLKFKGCFNMGIKQDIGFTLNDDGTKYIGNYNSGKINDFGAFQWNEGHIYYGQWKNEKMEGRGKFKWFNGDLFIGYYSKDLKSGDGEYFFSEQNSILKGIWQMGRKHGKFNLYKGGDKFMLIYKNDQQIS
jgi:hypothetical protein